MKVADAIKQMSKLPLQRIVDSFTKDFPKPDESQARDIILRNVEELTDPERIASVLRFDGPFSEQIRLTCMLEAFVNRPNWSASEHETELLVIGGRVFGCRTLSGKQGRRSWTTSVRQTAKRARFGATIEVGHGKGVPTLPNLT